MASPTGNQSTSEMPWSNSVGLFAASFGVLWSVLFLKKVREGIVYIFG